MYSDGTRVGVNLIGDSSLKPEKGTHYELGWKKENDKTQYKVALFATRIKDNITYSKGSGSMADKWFARNEDFKNHGLEASVTVRPDDHWTWHAGITWQDPKSKVKSSKPGDKNYWDRTYGRFVLNTGISYEKDKWTAALNANYLADRVLSPTSAHSFDEKPYLLTSLNVKYSPNKDNDISLTVNNILDRDDNINHTSSHYSSTPINWILTYGYKF
jgi:iron complex outermembrane receptor protein